MRRLKLLLFVGTVMVISASTIIGCATIIKSECELQTFEGTYAGRYNVGGLIPIPIEDTVVIVVDLANNQATVTSILLDTTFLTNYQENNKQLIIGSLDIPVFNLGENQLYDISVDDGFGRLDGLCEKLYLQLNNVSVQDHNFDGFPKPINNLDLTSPNFMRRL